jgi:hypothetical protein
MEVVSCRFTSKLIELLGPLGLIAVVCTWITRISSACSRTTARRGKRF